MTLTSSDGSDCHFSNNGNHRHLLSTKRFEHSPQELKSLGPAFQADTGYPRGSLQIANMIVDGLRRPDDFMSAGSIPIKKLMNGTDPLADWLKSLAREMVIAISR